MTTKIVIAGAGGVGSSVAFNLVFSDLPVEIVLVDRRAEQAASHVMDLEQVLELGGSHAVRGGAQEEIPDADVLVVSASVPFELNSTRHAFLGRNAAIVGEIGDRLAGVDGGWNGVAVVVSNPVDPLCAVLHRRAGIDRRRVLGYVLNDTLRLRTGIARALGVGPGRVEAWVLGEHGNACVPLLDRVRLDGQPIELTRTQRSFADEFLRTWYVRHVALDSGRTSTWTSGLGVARMVEAIVGDRRMLWPVSVVLDGEYGVEGPSLGVPVTVGRGGVGEILEWPLAPVERRAFEQAAGCVEEALSGLTQEGLA